MALPVWITLTRCDVERITAIGVGLKRDRLNTGVDGLHGGAPRAINREHILNKSTFCGTCYEELLQSLWKKQLLAFP